MSSKPDISVATRLQKSLDYLSLARTSRSLDYAAIPYVVAAEYLIQLAIEKQAGKQ